MIDAVLHIDWVSEPLEAFANSHEHRVKANFPKAVYYALDAHSSDLAWHFAQQLLQQAQQISVMVEVGNQEIDPAAWKILIGRLLRYKQKIVEVAIVGSTPLPSSLVALGVKSAQFLSVAHWLGRE